MKELNPRHAASDFRQLIGFTLTATSDVPGDGTYLTFCIGRGVEIEAMYDDRAMYITDPYGIDTYRNKI